MKSVVRLIVKRGAKAARCRAFLGLGYSRPIQAACHWRGDPAPARLSRICLSEKPDPGDGEVRVKCPSDGHDADPAQLREVKCGVDPVRGEIGEGKPDAVPIW